MSEKPKCPNCGVRMIVVREPAGPDQQYTFECETCRLLFMAPRARRRTSNSFSQNL